MLKVGDVIHERIPCPFDQEEFKMPESDQSTMRLLQAAAYVVVVAWGIKTASHILSIIFISLLLTYVILPFPKWLMRRFHSPKGLAIPLTVAFVVTIYFVVSVALLEASFQLREKIPLYVEHFRTLHERIAVFLSAHGIQSAQLSLKNMYSSDRIIEFARLILPTLIGLFSDRLLISLLSLIFLIEMADPEGAETGPLARNLAYYGADVQAFITISAKTGAINALANFVILIALGVDFPVVWCFLYFFLHFIPNVGFLISLIPPTLMALLMLGWKRALLVLGGLILTEMLGDYVVKPMLMIKGLHVSLLQIMLSLMIWGFLLGPAGAVLAIPLTLALRKYIDSPLVEAELPAAQASG
jgi:predicted PurR-regulated permease PerM